MRRNGFAERGARTFMAWVTCFAHEESWGHRSCPALPALQSLRFKDAAPSWHVLGLGCWVGGRALPHSKAKTQMGTAQCLPQAIPQGRVDGQRWNVKQVSQAGGRA